ATLLGMTWEEEGLLGMTGWWPTRDDRMVTVIDSLNCHTERSEGSVRYSRAGLTYHRLAAFCGAVLPIFSHKNFSCSISTAAISYRSGKKPPNPISRAQPAALSYSQTLFVSSLPAKYMGRNQPENRQRKDKTCPTALDRISRKRAGCAP